MDPILFGSILVTLAFFSVFVGANLMLRGRTLEIAGRLDQLPRVRFPRTALTPEAAARRKPGRLSRILTLGTGPDLAGDIARADLHLTPAEYVGISLLSILAGFVLAFFIFHENVFLALGGALVGLFAPRWVLGYLQRKRLREFDGQLGDVVVLVANSLRSGYSLLQSMETVTKELAPPVSVEFARVTREVGLGLTLQEALSNLYRRIPSDDLDFMITAINIQHEVGGNLAEILDVIAHTIRERVRIMGEIRAITAQQRLSAIVLSLLPVALGLAIYALNPEYVSELWHYTCGLVMLIVGGILIILGYLVVRRIAAIEV